jgi:hypothetical protein
MARYSNQEIFNALQNGEDAILLYLTEKYYQSARRMLRRSGFRDSDTPTVFSNVIIKIAREVQQNNLSATIDFEPFFFNTLQEYMKDFKALRKDGYLVSQLGEKEIVISCFSILDESSRKILAARYAEKLSFEQIAARFEFSNPMIAQYEFNKAFSIFGNISKARLNIKED